MVVEVLLLLSAIKFALVAMFYMHLKSDGKLLSSIFGFSLLLAAVMIGALMIIFTYLYSHSPTAESAEVAGWPALRQVGPGSSPGDPHPASWSPLA